MPPQARPLLLGHRGCRLRGFRENSIPAFAHAMESGCDGFEFDVRQTADQKAICVHDASIGRDRVQISTYDQLFIRHLKKSEGPESLPCLPDVFARFASTAFLDIELKVSGLERQTLELLRTHPPQRGYFISSFLPEVICTLAELAPEIAGKPIQLGYVFDTVSGLHAWPNMPGPWIVPRRNLVSRELVNSVHTAGRKLMAWTVNRPAELLRFADWGVDGLISDDPKLLCDTINGRR